MNEEQESTLDRMDEIKEGIEKQAGERLQESGDGAAPARDRILIPDQPGRTQRGAEENMVFESPEDIDHQKLIRHAPEGSSAYRLRAFIRNVEYKFRSMNNACVTAIGNKKTVVYLDPEYIAENVRNYYDLFTIIFHELTHVVVGHFVMPKVKSIFPDEYWQSPQGKQVKNIADESLVHHLTHLALPGEEYHDVIERTFRDMGPPANIYSRRTPEEEIPDYTYRQIHERIFSEGDFSARESAYTLKVKFESEQPPEGQGQGQGQGGEGSGDPLSKPEMGDGSGESSEGQGDPQSGHVDQQRQQQQSSSDRSDSGDEEGDPSGGQQQSSGDGEGEDESQAGGGAPEDSGEEDEQKNGGEGQEEDESEGGSGDSGEEDDEPEEGEESGGGGDDEEEEGDGGEDERSEEGEGGEEEEPDEEDGEGEGDGEGDEDEEGEEGDGEKDEGNDEDGEQEGEDGQEDGQGDEVDENAYDKSDAQKADSGEEAEEQTAEQSMNEMLEENPMGTSESGFDDSVDEEGDDPEEDGSEDGPEEDGEETEDGESEEGGEDPEGQKEELMEAMAQVFVSGGDSAGDSRAKVPNSVKTALQPFLVKNHREIKKGMLRSASEPSFISRVCKAFREEVGKHPRRSVMPHFRGNARAMARLQQGIYQSHYKKPARQSEELFVLYYDISGTQKKFVPQCNEIVVRNRKYLAGKRLFCFSGILQEVATRDFMSHYRAGTVMELGNGSTNFEIVVEHARKNGFKRLAVMTDEKASIRRKENVEYLEMLQQKGYLLLINTCPQGHGYAFAEYATEEIEMDVGS